MSGPEIVAPVCGAAEVAHLAAAGATRLYCGLQPRAWNLRYSRASWLSRRPPSACLERLSELDGLVREADRYDVQVDVALNAPSFESSQLDMLLDLARSSIRSVGVGAVIVADVALMQALGDEGLPFVASTVFVAHNEGALRLVVELGARRAVLPRHLRIDEVAALVRAVPELPLEAIVRFDGCPWEEGLCRTVHGVPGLPPMCQAARRWSVETTLGAAPLESAEWADVLGDYARWLDDADEGSAPAGTSPLDRIPALVSAGVRGLKIAGRQSPLPRRLAGVREVRGAAHRRER